MRQNSPDYRRVFNAGDDFDLPPTALAGLDLDIKNSLEPLHPGHRLVALVGRLVQPVFPGLLTPLASPAPFSRSDTHTKLTIGGENPVKARQIRARLRTRPARPGQPASQ